MTNQLETTAVLTSLWSLTVALRGMPSNKDKVSFLADRVKNDIPLRSVLRSMYHPYVHYHLKSSTVKSSKYPAIPNDLEIGQILRRLHKRKISSGKEAIGMWKGLLERIHHPELQTAADLCLDKDLKSRVGVKLINQAFEMNEIPLIPEFSVALGEKLSDHKLDFEEDVWFASRKLDGVRCIAILDGDSVTLLSREGIMIDNFPHIEMELSVMFRDYAEDGLVLDGELSIVRDGVDDFSGVMKVLRSKKNPDVSKVCFNCFDMLSLESFTDRRTSVLFSRRLRRLSAAFEKCPSRGSKIRLVTQWIVGSQDDLDIRLRSAFTNGWEGLILRKDAPYQGKRSKDIFKVKKKGDAEFKVLETVNGTMGIMVDGRNVEVPCMSAAVISYKGNKVKVGSGWSVKERRRFHADSSLIIGKLITVEFMEESVDSKTGLPSLRHPVVKAIHDGDVRTF
jgi:DNA ligase-1